MGEELNLTPQSQEVGSVKIADEVVAIVASLAGSGIKGVHSMSNSIADGLSELIGKKNVAKGVKVAIDNKSVDVDMYIIVEYGHRIPEVAWGIQEKVKTEIENMTGLTVNSVNVHVQGVQLEAKKEKLPSVQEEAH